MNATSAIMVAAAAGTVAGEAPPRLPGVAAMAAEQAPADSPAAYRAAILARWSTMASAGPPSYLLPGGR
jgi:hypothetical protein